MTAGDEESATYFVNFMTKNGLVAQHTWTAAAAPREEMCTRREWDKHEILGNLAVGTRGGLCFDVRDSQSETLQNRTEHVHEHRLQSSFLGNMSKEEKKHATKTNIRSWTLSHSGKTSAKN